MERERERGKEKNDRISASQETFIDHLRWLSRREAGWSGPRL